MRKAHMGIDAQTLEIRAIEVICIKQLSITGGHLL